LAEDPRHSAVLTDFDGTLALIVDDPAAATVLPAARAALAALVDRFGRVGVVSGRPVRFLQATLDLPGLVLVGQYGLERATDAGVVVDERAEPYLPAVAQAADELDAALPDVLIERKDGVAVTVHWRTHAGRAADAIAVAEAVGAEHGLAVHAGRMSRELRPPVAVDKGSAAAGLAAGCAAACFAGDDAGDVPAFTALGQLVDQGELGAAVGIAVRSSEAPDALLERADLVVDGPAALAELFAELASPL
jgi:trehalose 6-phosphate phosphatase